MNDFARWPAYIEGSRFSKNDIRKMVYKADVVHFHINVKPFFGSLKLDPKRFEDKKTLVYYHGSFLRYYQDKLTKPARELLPNHLITVSTPDLLGFLSKDERVAWLPVSRSFEDIGARYGWTQKDLNVRRSFAKKKILIFGHPSSNVHKKGSKLFFEALTELMREDPRIRSNIIINTAWDSCIRQISEMDVVLGNAELPGTYGLVCVEAGIFKKPAISLITPDAAKAYKTLTGERPPIISWRKPEEVPELFRLVANKPETRQNYGLALHKYMKSLHDDKPLVNYYLDLIKNRT